MEDFVTEGLHETTVRSLQNSLGSLIEEHGFAFYFYKWSGLDWSSWAGLARLTSQQIFEWCEANVECSNWGTSPDNYYIVWFSKAEDALHFKLRWR